MSAERTGNEQMAPVPGGPSLRGRIAAVAVVLALAALAAYTMFSGPTTVAVRAPTSAPARSAPPSGEQGVENEEGGRGD